MGDHYCQNWQINVWKDWNYIIKSYLYINLLRNLFSILFIHIFNSTFFIYFYIHIYVFVRYGPPYYSGHMVAQQESTIIIILLSSFCGFDLRFHHLQPFCLASIIHDFYDFFKTRIGGMCSDKKTSVVQHSVFISSTGTDNEPGRNFYSDMMKLASPRFWSPQQNRIHLVSADPEPPESKVSL